MNEHDVAIKKRKPVSKRDAKISALMLAAMAIVALVMCIHIYLNSSYLVDGSAFNAAEVHDMRVIIKVAIFGTIPGLSILLILGSRLIWKLSKELRDDSAL